MKQKRAVVTRYGGPETIQIIEEERPEPKLGEVQVNFCLPQSELVPVPSGLDSAEAVSLVLNYITAFQMMHHAAKVKPGQRVLIHGASGGVGTPIDYKNQDYVKEIHRLTGEGVDAVFDPIGGTHLRQSRKALRRGGRVVGYGLVSSIRGKGLTSGKPGRRQRFRGSARFGLYIVGGWLLPGRKRVIPYSIQTIKRVKPALFRQDLANLFDLLQQKKLKPVIDHRFPLAEARQAQELLGKGGVVGKIVLVNDGSTPANSGAP